MTAADVIDLQPPCRAAPGEEPLTDGRGRGLALLCAAVCLVGTSASVIAAPMNCAEVKATVEKRMQARGAAPPELLIVPRNLARGHRVVGTCEDGTQKIVQRAAAAPSAAAGRGDAGSAGSARQPLP